MYVYMLIDTGFVVRMLVFLANKYFHKFFLNKQKYIIYSKTEIVHHPPADITS